MKGSGDAVRYRVGVATDGIGKKRQPTFIRLYWVQQLYTVKPIDGPTNSRKTKTVEITHN